MSKTISAIIATHNYARFLRTAIDSVFAQSYPPVEVIVVDDGSTDNTPEILSEYGDRIRVIRQQNRGPAVARNAGILASSGDYIAMLDSDDFWHPHKLAKQLAAFDENPSLGAVGCARQMIDGDGRPIRVMPIRTPVVCTDLRAQLRRIALRQLWVEGSCTGSLVPRRVLDEIGLFDESLSAAEDWDLWMRLAARYPFRNLPEVLVSIRLHGTGFARSADKVEKNQWKIFESAKAMWPDAFDFRLRQRVRALIYADAGGEYLGHRDYRPALARYAASLRAWPFDARRWYVTAKLLAKRVRS